MKPILAAAMYALTIGASAGAYTGYSKPNGETGKPKRKSSAKNTKKAKRAISKASQRNNRK